MQDGDSTILTRAQRGYKISKNHSIIITPTCFQTDADLYCVCVCVSRNDQRYFQRDRARVDDCVD